MYSGDYYSQRYSRLDQIDRDSAPRLQLQWAYQLRALDRAETTPLVVDGVMYVTESPSNVIASTPRPAGRTGDTTTSCRTRTTSTSAADGTTGRRDPR